MIFDNIEEAENYLDTMLKRKDIIIYNGANNIFVHNCYPLIKYSGKYIFDNKTIYHIESESDVNLQEQVTRLIVSELLK